MKRNALTLCFADDPATASRPPRVSRPPVIFVLVQSNVSADGGIASISQIITRLREHRAIIVTDRESSRTRQWRSAGIETHVIPQAASRGLSQKPLKVLGSYVRYARELGRLIAASGARVVHANDPAALQLAIVPAKLARARLVLSLRGTFDPAQLPSRIKYRMLFAAADRVLYLSYDMAHRWARHVPNAKAAYSVTYSVVDPARFRPSPIDWGSDPIVLISGLIRPLKGQLEFIQYVVPKLVAKGVKVQFAGDFDPARNGYMAACAEAAEPFGDLVQFLGYREDIPELIATSTVIAVPSQHEGMVRAMIEGMSCGRPIVSFDVCSAREILQQQADGAGVVIDSRNYGAMADAILGFCKNRDLADAAGERGHSAAMRLFAPDEVVSRYEHVYECLSPQL